jgi:hypothetical protein
MRRETVALENPPGSTPTVPIGWQANPSGLVMETLPETLIHWVPATALKLLETVVVPTLVLSHQ